MPDFAPNFTPRYKVNYTVHGKGHSFQVRVARGTTDPTGVATKMGSFLAAMEGLLLASWTAVSASFALEDTDIFLPAPVPTGFTPASSESGLTTNVDAIALSFVGRSANGGRGMLFLYGTGFGLNVTTATYADYRITAAESTAISDAVSALDELSPALVANDNGVVNWYGYANIKANDYWVDQLRP